MKKSVYLALENGALFAGEAPCFQEVKGSGEVVFTTGMTGYCESLTDPSYAGQILVFTFPLIGNYGVPPSSHWESKKIHAAGVIFSEKAPHWSHHQGAHSLCKWLEEQKVPYLSGVDTRALTKLLRVSGSMLGSFVEERQGPHFFEDPNQRHLVSHVSLKEKMNYGEGKKRVIAVDCGMKESMIRQLSSFPIEIIRVPFDYDYTQEAFDGLFLSNGPGDPMKAQETIAILKKALKMKKPIFGVCLGSQLLALATGAMTKKLKFGHRGHNQPCMDLKTRKCYVTSQNHGFAVDEATLLEGWEVSFRNLNDGSVEGIAHTSLPFAAVQFHPEATPGPTDTRFLFERFYSWL